MRNLPQDLAKIHRDVETLGAKLLKVLDQQQQSDSRSFPIRPPDTPYKKKQLHIGHNKLKLHRSRSCLMENRIIPVMQRFVPIRFIIIVRGVCEPFIPKTRANRPYETHCCKTTAVKSHFHNLSGTSRQKLKQSTSSKGREPLKKISKERSLSPNVQPDTVSKKPTQDMSTSFIKAQLRDLRWSEKFELKESSSSMNNPKKFLSELTNLTQTFDFDMNANKEKRQRKEECKHFHQFKEKDLLIQL
ncbi:hypothetical protein B9Z55_027380 [Caenorhabditis nigoni]|nr:hypothetical protein B9Z55_027380 [Caenorhabditis nigoni]